jgi:uncharacterized protein YbaR (Trm112 family)
MNEKFNFRNSLRKIKSLFNHGLDDSVRIVITCPYCTKKLSIPETKKELIVTCPTCHKKFDYAHKKENEKQEPLTYENIKPKQEIETNSTVNKPSGWIKRSAEKLYIQVGVDFGTSNTKAAYTIIGKNKEVIPVIFNSKRNNGYCYPSVGAYTEQGQLVFGHEASDILGEEELSSGLKRFKMLVAGKYDTRFSEEQTLKNYKQYLTRFNKAFYIKHPEALSAVFLSNVFKKIIESLNNSYPTNELDISYNVCLPIDQYQESALLNPFQKILMVAHKLSKMNLSNEEAIDYAKEELKTIIYEITSSENRVFAIPEAVAEISSYIQSFGAQNGLHVLLDFGSGTTDISVINIKNLRKANERWVWYSATNIPHGMHSLEKIIEQYNYGCTSKEVEYSLNNLREISDEEIEAIKKDLNALWKKTAQSGWTEAYAHLKDQSFWKPECVRVFISGGGANSPDIKNIFSRSGMNHYFSGWTYDHDIEKIPVPDNYQDNTKYPFHRLCLAYGLTMPYGVLRNKYILPKDAPNDTPPIMKIIKSDWEMYSSDYWLMDK